MSLGNGVDLPKIIPYKDLMVNVNNIDIGELLPASNFSFLSLTEGQKIYDVYRDLEALLVALAKFYLDTDQYRDEENKLRWFGSKEVGHLRAVGGDGAPFGKWDESTSWLVSFLNVGPVFQVRMTTSFYSVPIVRKRMKLSPNFVSYLLPIVRLLNRKLTK